MTDPGPKCFSEKNMPFLNLGFTVSSVSNVYFRFFCNYYYYFFCSTLRCSRSCTVRSPRPVRFRSNWLPRPQTAAWYEPCPSTRKPNTSQRWSNGVLTMNSDGTSMKVWKDSFFYIHKCNHLFCWLFVLVVKRHLHLHMNTLYMILYILASITKKSTICLDICCFNLLTFE